MFYRWRIAGVLGVVAIACIVYTRAGQSVTPISKQLVLNREQVGQLYDYIQPEWDKESRNLQGNQYAGVLLTLQEACGDFFAKHGPSATVSLTITLEAVGREGHVRWSFPVRDGELMTGERQWSGVAIQRGIAYVDQWHK